MKILALPYGYSVAHTSRLLEISKILRQRGHEIIFAGSGNCLDIALNEGFEVLQLADVPIQRVVEALRTTNFSLLYGDPKEMKYYIEQELQLYNEIKPDLILVDDRRTASASAKLAAISHVSVVNAHVTNYSYFPLLLPFYRKNLKWKQNSIIVKLIHSIQVKIERFIYNSTLKGIHQARAGFNLDKLFAYQITEGNNLTLIPDVPEFTPLKNSPENFHYVGPITWHSDLPPIDYLEQFKNYPKKAYFTLGSGGFQEFINHLSIFEKSDFSIIVTAGELIDEVINIKLPQNIFVEKYVNADIILPYCDVIVCHGGNGTVYQALKYGVPVISIPSHNEQDYNARRVEQLGLGKRLSSKQVIKDFSSVLNTMEGIVNNPIYKENVKKFRLFFNNYDGIKQAADLIEKYFN